MYQIRSPASSMEGGQTHSPRGGRGLGAVDEQDATIRLRYGAEREDLELDAASRIQHLWGREPRGGKGEGAIGLVLPLPA